MMDWCEMQIVCPCPVILIVNAVVNERPKDGILVYHGLQASLHELKIPLGIIM